MDEANPTFDGLNHGFRPNFPGEWEACAIAGLRGVIERADGVAALTYDQSMTIGGFTVEEIDRLRSDILGQLGLDHRGRYEEAVRVAREDEDRRAYNKLHTTAETPTAEAGGDITVQEPVRPVERKLSKAKKAVVQREAEAATAKMF